MRVRDHVALSTAGALALRPWTGRGVAGAWAASILVDVDHYLWFAARSKTLDLPTAVRYFNGPHPSSQPTTRVLHNPFVVCAALLLGMRRRAALKIALGMAVHVAMDTHHEARLRAAREAVLRRDDFTCRGCGTRGRHVETHLWRQPLLLPSYWTANFVSLCPGCHDAAHRREGHAVPAGSAPGRGRRRPQPSAPELQARTGR
jgi:hypothetical protein